jgi:hypothetical protein
MRTTIRLDDDLLREAKRAAMDSGQTLTALIESALRERLARRKQPQKRERIKLITAPGGGLLPGVDLSNNAAVRDLMDEEDLPHGPFHG